MNGINGMEAAKRLYDGGFSGSFVFCTESREHAAESYAVNADGYLVKPYTWEAFRHAMEQCRPRWQKNLATLSFVSERLDMTVYRKDLLYIETKRHGCTVHARSKALPTRKTIGEFQNELRGEDGFLCVGQGYIVNLAYMEDWDDDAIQLVSGERVLLPVRERAKYRRILTDYRWLQMEEN